MTLSVAGALVELKLLDKRIQKAMQTGLFVYFKQGNEVLGGYKSEEEVSTKIKSSTQSVLDLIDRRNKIKAAIVVSNATTKVTVGDYEMTVAEAIERKTSIQYDKNLLSYYRTQLANTLRTIDNHNADLENRADLMVQQYLGNDKSKATEAQTIREGFVTSKQAKLIDAIDIKKQIEVLEDEIDTFESEVDLALSTSNAITQLEI